MPKTGPSDGWRMAAMVRDPTRLSAIESPMVVVVLPSPSGVGVMAVTSMYLPFGRPASRFMSDSMTLALCLPYSSSSSSSMPRPAAISAMGFMRARCAISRSDIMGALSCRLSRGRYRPVRTAARSMRTAQTLYSGIFDDGSWAEFVRKFAAESASLTKGTKIAPGRTASVRRA